MSQAAYSLRAAVLRKTKLGEYDLILTLLAEDGSQLRAVAKGARKPTSPFASRLELFSAADLLVAPGRSLAIIKEARSLSVHLNLSASLELSACAAPIAELLARLTQQDLPVARLFDLSCASFDALEETSVEEAPCICAAALLKIFALCGFRPGLRMCVNCTKTRPQAFEGQAFFSISEGGWVCEDCKSQLNCIPLLAEELLWADALLFSSYAAIHERPCDARTAFSLLHLLQQWSLSYAQARLKSLDFLFTSGLF